MNKIPSRFNTTSDAKTVVYKSCEGYNIGVLTSGGDSQGMNAAIKGVVRMGIYLGCKVFFIKEGYDGMIEGGKNIVEANWASVSGIIHLGGTVIGSVRSMEFMKVSGRIKAAKNLIENNITRLIIIGGDGSLTGANTFTNEWEQLVDALVCKGEITEEQAKKHQHLNIAGIVGSIDNDFCDTDMTIGTDSALTRIVEAVNILRSTAYSHQRTFVMEVMGRHCGYLGLCGAIAVGADFAFYPENPVKDNWAENLCNMLNKKRKRGKRLNIIIVSEGAIDIHGNPITANEISEVIKDKLKFDSRVTVLGHLQRGGSPSSFDRILGLRMGSDAVLAVLENNEQPCVITIDGIKTKRLPLVPLVAKTRSVQAAMDKKDWEKVQQLRGKSFISKMHSYEILNSFDPDICSNELKGYNFAIMHIGSITSGFNSTIRVIARYCMSKGGKIYAISNGIDGILNECITEVYPDDVSEWYGTGCALGTSRTLPSKNFEKIATVFKKYSISGLFMVGGFNGFIALIELLDARKTYDAFFIPIILMPSTVSNNVPGTDICVGCDTALNAITKICDGVKQATDGNQKRIFVIETMGANCGYLAATTALASGADSSYIFEEPFTIHDLYRDVIHMKYKIDSGINRGLTLRSERACNFYTSDFIHKLYSKEGKDIFSTRTNLIGHIQQGWTPSPFDRKLAIRFAMKGLEWMMEQVKIYGKNGQIVTNSTDTVVIIGICSGSYKITPICELKNMADIENQVPINQWWMNLRPLFRIISKHPLMYEPDTHYEETFI